jgi:hypothetical protein
MIGLRRIAVFADHALFIDGSFHALQRRGLRAIVLEIGQGDGQEALPHGLVSAHHGDQPSAAWHRHRLEQHGVDEREHHRVETNAEGEGRHNREREPAMGEDHSQGKAQIVSHQASYVVTHDTVPRLTPNDELNGMKAVFARESRLSHSMTAFREDAGNL